MNDARAGSLPQEEASPSQVRGKAGKEKAMVQANFTAYKRAVNAPALGWFLDHTYVQAAAGPQTRYTFTCYDTHSRPASLPGTDTAINDSNGNPFGERPVEFAQIMACGMPAARMDFNLATDTCNLRYLRDGVCHQMANRLLVHPDAPAGAIVDPSTIRGGRISTLLYGLFGRKWPDYLHLAVDRYLALEAGNEPTETEDAAQYSHYVESIYNSLINSTKSQFLRELIALDFQQPSEKTLADRFNLFMGNAFVRRYDGSYQEVSATELAVLVAAYEVYQEEEWYLSGLVTKDFAAYARAMTNALQGLIKQFHATLGDKRYKMLFYQPYTAGFSFLPEGLGIYSAL